MSRKLTCQGVHLLAHEDVCPPSQDITLDGAAIDRITEAKTYTLIKPPFSPSHDHPSHLELTSALALTAHFAALGLGRLPQGRRAPLSWCGLHVWCLGVEAVGQHQG